MPRSQSAVFAAACALFTAAVFAGVLMPPPAHAQAPAAGNGPSTVPGAPLPDAASPKPKHAGPLTAAEVTKLRAQLTQPVDPAQLDRFRTGTLQLVRDLRRIVPALADDPRYVNPNDPLFNQMGTQAWTQYYNATFDGSVDPGAHYQALAQIHQAALNRGKGRYVGPSDPGVSQAPEPPPGLNAPLERLANASLAPNAPLALDAIPPLTMPVVPPDYGPHVCATALGEREDKVTVYALIFVLFDLRNALEAISTLCDSIVTIAGFGTNLDPLCIGTGTANTLYTIQEGAVNIVKFCDGIVDFANIKAAVGNTVAIHANLDEHNMRGTEDLNSIQQFLDSFQRLSTRMKIEADLLQSGDSRTSIFQLPTAFGGNLETTRDVVTDTIARNLASGLSVGNALDQLTAGNDSFAQNLYKDAYARYREAYQAAVAQY